MKDFNYSIPTEIFFGNGKIKTLGEEILKYGNKVLLVFGGGSIKANGIYDSVVGQLDEYKISFYELGGVEPNPKIDSVRKGKKICKENNIDFILAVGGGSSIDCAKAIGASFYYKGDPWDLVIDNSKIKKALPIGAVLTMAATGSEMNMTAVISNPATNQKYSMKHKDLNPRFSILDPSYTFTVPKFQTASGVVDIMSHTLENYFSMDRSAYITDRLAEAVLKTCIRYGKTVVDEPENYEARANIMWASTLAINGILNFGKDVAWTVHTLEHELTAYYDDLPHGVGLAILTPNWMTYVLDEDNIFKFVEYGINVWEIDKNLEKKQIANEAINKTKAFFKSLGMPQSLSYYNIGRENFSKMAEAAIEYRGGLVGSFKPLDFNDIIEIYNMSL